MRKEREQRRKAWAEVGWVCFVFVLKSGFFSRLRSTGQGANSPSSFTSNLKKNKTPDPLDKQDY